MKVKRWTPVAQPYAEGYYQREKATMRMLKPYAADGVEVKVRDTEGRLDGYLYKDLRRIEGVPILHVDGTLWMSLTPMEVQSHYMPLAIAAGDVGVAGLGLGYAVQRMLTKPDVSSILVYETDPRVIALYDRNFGAHPKLRIVEQDVRESGSEEFDFFYADIYETIGDEAMWKDWALMHQSHSIGQYHAWGMEVFLWDFVCRGRFGDLPFWMQRQYRAFFLALMRSGRPLEMSHTDPEDTLRAWEETGLADEWGL